MRKVLVINYSQTGQLTRIADSVVKPLEQDSTIQLDYLKLEPEQNYPFSVAILRLFSYFS